MSDHIPEQSAAAVAFGVRLRVLRERRGMTRAVLAGLVGRSEEWLRSVEYGRRRVRDVGMLLRLAEALRVRDLADLVDRQVVGVELPAQLHGGPGHARLPAVRAAVDAVTLTAGAEPPPVAHLRGRLDAAWAARHRSSHHREVVGALLPDLIRDAQATVRAADRSQERREAQALMAEVWALAQFFLAYQPDAVLLWRVVERGMVAAQESGDPRAVGVSAWLAAEAHRDAGALEAAEAVTAEALRYLAPHRAAGPAAVRAIGGALEAAAGFTAARGGQAGAAWQWWDRAQRTAASLPAGYYDPITSYSRPVMGAHAVTLAVELRAGGEGVRQTRQAPAEAIPSRPRAARHRIETARAYQLAGDVEAALGTLEAAAVAAAETVAYNGYAKSLLLETATTGRRPAERQRAARLAVQIGALTG